MQTIRIKLTELEPNAGQIDGLPINPRQWSKSDVERIAKSLKETPELFEARPIIAARHGDKYIILGGNLRYEGAKQNGDQDAPCIVVPDDMSVEKMKEIVIKDNGTFGAWDFDALANEWDNLPLVDWGVPAWNTEEEPEIDDKPDLSDGIDFTYKLEIECVNESEQEQLYNELIGRGYKCRVLTL